MAAAAATLGTVRCDSHFIELPSCVLAELWLSDSDEEERMMKGQALRGKWVYLGLAARLHMSGERKQQGLRNNHSAGQVTVGLA